MELQKQINTTLSKVLAAFPFWMWIGLAGLAGGVATVGIYTFVYAQGLSYLSNDPKACVNCHVMRDVYEGWNHSSHKSVATCNDCHIPHNFPMKYLAKGRNGWHHSVAFTTGQFEEPIRIKKFNRSIIERNCLRCHSSIAGPIVGSGSAHRANCTRCHSRVGHDW
jgi:cytochrome c nitrite reductase small subunit